MEFDWMLCKAISGTVAKRMEKGFAAHPSLDADDLVQHAITACSDAWPKYDPKKAAASTFFYTVAHLRLIDLLRHLDTNLKHESNVGVTEMDADDAPEDALIDVPANATPVEYAAEVHRTLASRLARAKAAMDPSKKRHPRRRPGRPAVHTPAQAMTVLLLQRRFAWSARTAARMMKDQPSIAEALGLIRPPSRMTINRIIQGGPKFRKLFQAVPA